MGEGDDSVLHGDKVLDVHFAADGLDGGAALVAELVAYFTKLGLYDIVHQVNIGENRLVLGDALENFGELVLDFLPVKAGETSETHRENGVRLDFRKTEALHKAGTVLVVVPSASDDADNFVDVVLGDFETFENVLTLLRLAKVEPCAAGDDFTLEVDVVLEHLFKGEYLRLTVHEGEHNYADGVLELGIGEELVEHHLGVGFALELHDDTKSLAVGLVPKVADSLDAFFFDEVGDALNESSLVDHIGNLGDDYSVAVVLPLLNLRSRAEGYFRASGSIGGADSGATHNDAAGGEVRSLDMLHEVLKGGVRVVDKAADGFGGLPKVMGRDIGRHTDGDTDGAVNKKVRVPRGEDHRLLETVVVVRHKIDGLLVDVREHLGRHAAHTALGITVGCGRVAVNGTEVSVTVNEGRPH